jgi:two-component system OmpR family response regulator
MCTPQRPASLSVLVVDDDPDAADSLADLLRLCGHRVTVARTALDALEAADRERPDVALLDIGLPGMSGWQVARRVREQEQWRGGRRTLIVSVTGYGADADRWRSVEAGVDLHLVKPADPQFLIGMLERFGRGVERASSLSEGGDAAAAPGQCPLDAGDLVGQHPHPARPAVPHQRHLRPQVAEGGGQGRPNARVVREGADRLLGRSGRAGVRRHHGPRLG